MSIGSVGMSRQNVSFGARNVSVDPSRAGKALAQGVRYAREADVIKTIKTLMPKSEKLPVYKGAFEAVA